MRLWVPRQQLRSALPAALLVRPHSGAHESQARPAIVCGVLLLLLPRQVSGPLCHLNPALLSALQNGAIVGQEQDSFETLVSQDAGSSLGRYCRFYCGKNSDKTGRGAPRCWLPVASEDGTDSLLVGLHVVWASLLRLQLRKLSFLESD